MSRESESHLCYLLYRNCCKIFVKIAINKDIRETIRYRNKNKFTNFLGKVKKFLEIEDIRRSKYTLTNLWECEVIISDDTTHSTKVTKYSYCLTLDFEAILEKSKIDLRKIDRCRILIYACSVRHFSKRDNSMTL